MVWILMGCELSCDYVQGRKFAFEGEGGAKKQARKLQDAQAEKLTS